MEPCGAYCGAVWSLLFSLVEPRGSYCVALWSLLWAITSLFTTPDGHKQGNYKCNLCTYFMLSVSDMGATITEDYHKWHEVLETRQTDIVLKIKACRKRGK